MKTARKWFATLALSTAMVATPLSVQADDHTAEENAAEEKTVTTTDAFKPDGELTFSKVDAVFKSGNATRDTVPQHLIVGEDVPADVARMYAHMCPAEVYDLQNDKLVVNPPNCIDCKATDVIGPRWTPREGGSGPRYRRM